MNVNIYCIYCVQHVNVNTCRAGSAVL